jgi:hypothetical protein
VSTTPAINPCQRFSVIAGVIDTANKFIAGVVFTVLLSVTTTPVIRVCVVSMDASFHGG